MKKVNIGSDRSMAINLNTDKGEILIVNVYMLTMDTNSKRDYQECIDTITSTVEAKSQVSWILCGDFNATLNPVR